MLTDELSGASWHVGQSTGSLLGAHPGSLQGFVESMQWGTALNGCQLRVLLKAGVPCAGAGKGLQAREDQEEEGLLPWRSN